MIDTVAVFRQSFVRCSRLAVPRGRTPGVDTRGCVAAAKR
jgi:hypothetical protein